MTARSGLSDIERGAVCPIDGPTHTWPDYQNGELRCDKCSRVCLTPGAVYSATVRGNSASVAVTLPRAVTEAEAVALERAIHDALEAALSPLYGGSRR